MTACPPPLKERRGGRKKNEIKREKIISRGERNQRNESYRRLVLLFCQQCHWAGHFGTELKTWIWTFVTDWLQYESTPPICFDCAASVPMTNKDHFDCVQAAFFCDRLDRPFFYFILFGFIVIECIYPLHPSIFHRSFWSCTSFLIYFLGRSKF